LSCSPGRILRAVLLASGAALVLLTHVFVTLDEVRVKAVQSPVAAAAGVAHASTSAFPSASLLRAPFALVLTVNNPSSDARFTVSVDGGAVCERSVASGAHRLDCDFAGEWNPAVSHDVMVSGPTSAWALDYVELATHHGKSNGANYLVLLPHDSRRYVPPAAAWAVVAWLALIAILLLASPPSWPRWAQLLYRVVAGALLLLLAASVASPWVSDYRLMLSAGTFVRWLVVLFAPRIWQAGVWLAEAGAAPRSRKAVAQAGLVAAITCAAYGAVVVAQLHDTYNGNYSGFLHVSSRLFDGNPLLSGRDDVRHSLVLQSDGGYDGQFMYFTAFDPLMRAYHDSPATYRRVVDAVPYRFGRIGFVWLTRVVSVGRWQWYPAAMVWLILMALALAALFLARAAVRAALPPVLGLLVIVVPGFWQSLQYGLPEPIAAAGLLGGVLALSRERTWLAGAFFGLSLLVRETGIIAVGCVLIGIALSGQTRRALLVGVVAMSAVVLWRVYMAWVLFPDWGIEGLLYHPGDLGWPMAGFLDLWRTVAHGQYYPGLPGLSRAAIAYPALLIGGFLLAAALAISAPSAVNIAAFLYACLAVSLNFEFIWNHVSNGQRGTYELFIMLALSCLAIRTYPRVLRAGLTVFWCAAGLYVFFGSFDASYIRTTLPIPF
jgi:hypothetical protein